MQNCLWKMYWCLVCLLILTRSQLFKKTKNKPKNLVCWNLWIWSFYRVKTSLCEVMWSSRKTKSSQPTSDTQQAQWSFTTASLHAALINMKMLYALQQAVASLVPECHKRSFRSHSRCHLSVLALIQTLMFIPNAPWPQHGHADLMC